MTALVLTLCHLHNFCIAEDLLQNKNCANNDDLQDSTDTNDSTSEIHAMDNANVVCDGGISLQDNERPTPLMDGGDHLDDVAPYEHRNVERLNKRNAGALGLPRELLRDEVVDQGLKRSTSASWLGKLVVIVAIVVYLLHLMLTNLFIDLLNLIFYQLQVGHDKIEVFLNLFLLFFFSTVALGTPKTVFVIK